jgi:hypothetical protein
VITKTEAIFLGIGVITHAAFIAAARHAHAPVYHYDDVAVAYVEVEIPTPPEDPHTDDPESPQNREVAANDRGASRSSERHRGMTAKGAQRNAASNGGDQSTGTPETTTPSLTQEPQPDEYDDPENPGFTMPGLNGSKVWQLPDVGGELGKNGPPAPTDTPRTKKVSRDKANDVLASAIKDKDKKLGLQLPAAGTVGSAARDIVWSSDLPETTQGTIVVQLGPDGNVVSVTIASQGPGTAAQWQAVAANLKASLSGRGLKLTDEYKKGAIITVSILSKMQNPSATDPGSPVHFGTTTTFDVSDIGAKPIRQVIPSVNVMPVK